MQNQRRQRNNKKFVRNIQCYIPKTFAALLCWAFINKIMTEAENSPNNVNLYKLSIKTQFDKVRYQISRLQSAVAYTIIMLLLAALKLIRAKSSSREYGRIGANSG
jgi:hypothetical protein